MDHDSGTFKYFLKLVPTTYISPRGAREPLSGPEAAPPSPQMVTSESGKAIGLLCPVCMAVTTSAVPMPGDCMRVATSGIPRGCPCSLAGRILETNQFSVTEYWSRISKGRMQMPAVFFVFDLAPITVTIRDTRGSFSHFLVRTCAVVGGVFAVTGELATGLTTLPQCLGCVFACSCFVL